MAAKYVRWIGCLQSLRILELKQVQRNKEEQCVLPGLDIPAMTALVDATAGMIRLTTPERSVRQSQ